MKTSTDRKDIQTLREMCRLQPDDPILRLQLAEALLAQGREVAGMMALREAYQRLREENPEEAERLVVRFGEEVAASATQPLAYTDYRPLAAWLEQRSRPLHRVRLREGEVLFRMGDPADAAWLVLEGKLAVTLPVDEGRRWLLLNYLHPGALFGESALHAGAQRIASIIADTPAVLLRLAPEDLQRALAAHPELHVRFSKETLWRRRMTMLSSSPLFARLPMDVRFLLARQIWEQGFQAGETIKERGRLLPCAALLVEGVAQLYEGGDGNLYVGRLRAGNLIGIHRWADYDARSIRIVAETPCRLLCMDPMVIEDLMEVSPWFASQIRKAGQALATRLQATLKLQRSTKE